MWHVSTTGITILHMWSDVTEIIPLCKLLSEQLQMLIITID